MTNTCQLDGLKWHPGKSVCHVSNQQFGAEDSAGYLAGTQASLVKLSHSSASLLQVVYFLQQISAGILTHRATAGEQTGDFQGRYLWFQALA